MGLAEQVSHAWRGACAEVAAQPGAVRRVRRALRLLLLVLRELAGTAQLAPYGLRAARCRREALAAGRLQSARYGDSPRNTLDVYLPASRDAAAPVVVFINGGVWSSGDAWQFAPLGRLLSDAGAVAAVAQYTLFPDATVPAMVAEVDAAVGYMQRNAARFGGDPTRVSVLGHSAGAHLAACALLARAASVAPADAALPPLHALIVMAGVYHVRRHYAYETWRGVNSISTMEAAMGGQAAFEQHSPSLALAAAADDVAARLPPVVVMGSEADTTVPWEQGEELFAPLAARGGAASHVVYRLTSHAHFAIGWEYGHAVEAPLLGHALAGPRGERMMAHAADVAAIVTGRVPPARIPQRLRAAGPPPARRGAGAATTAPTARLRQQF